MNSTPDEQGRIDLTLELTSDGNKVSTTSKLIIPKQDLPPKPSEPVQRQTAETEWPDNDGAKKAMKKAHQIATANAPKNVTEWPNDDDAQRARFRERLLASRVQDDEEQEEQEEQEEPVHPDRWCILPVNQPIYQALMDKAASYPADKVWQARAYRKAAQGILTYNYNIFDINNFMNWRYSNGIGYSIETFVGQFITDFKHLPDALNYLE